MWPPAEVIVSFPSRAPLLVVLPLALALAGGAVRGQDQTPSERAAPEPAAPAEPSPASTGPGSVEATPPSPSEGAPAEPPRRDPFRTSGAATPSGAPAASASVPALSRLALRGQIRLAGQPPAALLAVGGHLQVVRPGASLDVDVPAAAGAPARRQTLIVQAIERGSVTLSVGADGPKVVLR